MSQNNTKELILWVSPGFGMIDIWLPVIRQLKRKNIAIIFAFPEASSLRLETSNSDLFYLSNKL